MIRGIWIAMQVHEVMDEFAAAKFKYHTAISSAFVRFLTKQLGKKSMATQIEDLTKSIKDAADVANKAAKTAGDANSTANAAKSTAGKAQTKADNVGKTLGKVIRANSLKKT